VESSKIRILLFLLIPSLATCQFKERVLDNRVPERLLLFAIVDTIPMRSSPDTLFRLNSWWLYNRTLTQIASARWRVWIEHRDHRRSAGLLGDKPLEFESKELLEIDCPNRHVRRLKDGALPERTSPWTVPEPESALATTVDSTCARLKEQGQ
jgi:hypothetical protein